ncbi:Fe-S oxidoreductase [Frondihabitans sp. PAMC 28766]|uniref:Fe-S oxidoreductase n=1 Tax=Frondihabitans sp. PAMC 28766 TaxID=1795630 RepID=UPI00078CDD19|nr:Fe-S oxidoreductase [Frondihabitans sp. PAMC 28766]AMM21172.1 Fe-S oxidoreductase [Frondihabitans sp. PAMC 28766]
MKNPLLDSAVSRAGCAVATGVGLLLGVRLSTGRIRTRGDLIVCSGLPRWAFGRGGTCIGRVYLTRDNDGDDVLDHESVHVEQWQKYGMLMPILYAIAGRDASTNRFEIEAGLEKGGYR